MKHFFYQLKRVKFNEIIQIWKLPIALVCACFYRWFHKDLWIVCEDKNEARDNGYWFFKYVREHHAEQECVYAILNTSPDFEKVNKLGKTVQYGSLKHWILYFASTKKISSQKAGNPNAAIFYFLEVYGFLKDKRIFLQHGITINNAKWLYYDVTKMTKFICGAYPEKEYVSEVFGYPHGGVEYTGLCRFDGLHSLRKEKTTILIMPTWREWIADEDYRLKEYEGTTKIQDTEYFRKWRELLENENLLDLLLESGKRIVFYPHRNMQKYIHFLPESSETIKIARMEDYDVQDLMKSAAMMITDYSSVFVDMLYMKKPVVFYQFDYAKYREAQYNEGFFNYQDNAFTQCCFEINGLIKTIRKQIEIDFEPSQEYMKAHQVFFKLYDDHNCDRVFSVVRNI